MGHNLQHLTTGEHARYYTVIVSKTRDCTQAKKSIENDVLDEHNVQVNLTISMSDLKTIQSFRS